MKAIRYFLVVTGILFFIYLIGPRPEKSVLDPTIPEVSLSGTDLEDWINNRERNIPDIKQDNEARIVWFDDSLKKKTEYAVVYLPGFSASQGEGDPVHREFAREFGMNLYLARLYGHGIQSEENFIDLTVDKYLNSAKEAIAIGRQLGEKIILMSCSTGSTLSLFLASENSDIHSLIMYSPNIRLNNSGASLMSKPWGLQLTRLVSGGKYLDFKAQSSADSLYWTKKYRAEGTVALQQLIDETMKPSVFEKVKQPVFMGYYYKNEKEQDPVVVVEEMLKMYDRLGTPATLKRKRAFPDVGRHVIASKYKSKDWETVRDESIRFAKEILHLDPMVN